MNVDFDEQIFLMKVVLMNLCFTVAPGAPAASVRASTSLPLAAGGLGLRSALRLPRRP